MARAGLAVACSVLTLSLSSLAHAQQADAALLAASRAAEPAVIKTLEDLVNIESGSAQLDGLNRLADYAEQRLKALGGSTERLKATRGPGARSSRPRSTAAGSAASC